MTAKQELGECCMEAEAMIFTLSMQKKELATELEIMQRRLSGSDEEKHIIMKEDADKIEELMETNETLLKELENLQSQCQFQIETLIHRWNYFIFIFVEVLKIAPTMFL